MISARTIISSSLWIIGLSMLLAIWSLSYYQAQLSERKVGELLGQKKRILLISSGMVLVFVGFGLGDGRVWAAVIWFLLAALTAAYAVFSIRQSGNQQNKASG